MDYERKFENKVVEVLREVKGKYGVSFKMLFKGKILGGWLEKIKKFNKK
jgi:1-aminocyclopropane-1-carboxylate deaminase/D-cysteine desulfhydrase-like pyridoxal-dependent ACC family enzyme